MSPKVNFKTSRDDLSSSRSSPSPSRKHFCETFAISEIQYRHRLEFILRLFRMRRESIKGKSYSLITRAIFIIRRRDKFGTLPSNKLSLDEMNFEWFLRLRPAQRGRKCRCINRCLVKLIENGFRWNPSQHFPIAYTEPAVNPSELFKSLSLYELRKFFLSWFCHFKRRSKPYRKRRVYPHNRNTK